AHAQRVATQAGPEDLRVTRRRREQGGEHRQRGGLASAVRPEQRHGLSLIDVQRHAAYRLDLTEGAREVVQVHPRRLTHGRRADTRTPAATKIERCAAFPVPGGTAIRSTTPRCECCECPSPCARCAGRRLRGCRARPWSRGRSSHQGGAVKPDGTGG